jgi:hypothetical protein
MTIAEHARKICLLSIAAKETCDNTTEGDAVALLLEEIEQLAFRIRETPVAIAFLTSSVNANSKHRKRRNETPNSKRRCAHDDPRRDRRDPAGSDALPLGGGKP